jgi:hypothetical protein
MLSQTPPPPPPAPQVPAAPAVERVAPVLLSPPRTEAAVEALKARRSELSRQLTSAEGRRNGLAKQLLISTGPSRSGLEQRIAQLDQRIMQIEGDLALVGQQLSMAGPELAQLGTETSDASRPFGMNSGQTTAVSIVFTIFVLFPLALAFARLLWKRGTAARHPTPPPESGERLERLEQAVDAIAIEIERVSEGQRFVTQILTRGDAQSALGVGQGGAEPMRVRVPDRVRASGETG